MKSIFKFIKILIIAIIIIYIYARYIEPTILNVHYENLENRYIQYSKEIKILQFSDTHISEYFNTEDLEKVVEKINKEKPDIVVFTGDLIDHYDIYNDDVSLIWETLDKIEAPLGKYAVYGNHDYGGGAERIYKEILENSDFTLLINESIKLNDYKINIVGLDDSIFGNVENEKLPELLVTDYYNIVLSHEPDIVDYLLEYDMDLFLTGHSHGGQVNLPVVSSLMLPSLGEKYIRGLYKFENARNTNLYVNIGIGTSQIPLRFMSIPELSVFIINNTEMQ